MRKNHTNLHIIDHSWYSVGYATLKNKKDIASLFSFGRSYGDKNLRIRFLNNESKDCRVLFAMPKKSAHKPKRNTQIRRMRVIARSTFRQYEGHNIAFLICNPHASFQELRTSYVALMNKISKHTAHENFTFQ